MLIKACIALLFACCIQVAFASPAVFTILDVNHYRQTVLNSRREVKKIIEDLPAYRGMSLRTSSASVAKDLNLPVAFIVDQLMNTPYQYRFAMGEGDWQPKSLTYKPNALHIMQEPVYRFDRFDCQTFVQTVMALLKANNLSQFERNYLQIAYGAAGNPQGEIVRYFNRNHFVDADFNPVNQRNGFLVDVTSIGALAKYAKKTTVEINRQAWFLHQQQNAADYVRVLNAKDGPAMYQRFKTLYANLNFPHFQKERLKMTYLPKEELALLEPSGTYVPNDALFRAIPTPAVVEIVRDARKWKKKGMNIKEWIGSETSISHLGIVYRRRFQLGELIYHKISCDPGRPRQERCRVKPIQCKRRYCDELMFANATDAYPHDYFWYQSGNNQFNCTRALAVPAEPYVMGDAKGGEARFFPFGASKSFAFAQHKNKKAFPRFSAGMAAKALPSSQKSFTFCNRVESLPLFDYLTNFQYGDYAPMADSSILGIHIERIR